MERGRGGRKPGRRRRKSSLSTCVCRLIPAAFVVMGLFSYRVLFPPPAAPPQEQQPPPSAVGGLASTFLRGRTPPPPSLQALESTLQGIEARQNTLRASLEDLGQTRGHPPSIALRPAIAMPAPPRAQAEAAAVAPPLPPPILAQPPAATTGAATTGGGGDAASESPPDHTVVAVPLAAVGAPTTKPPLVKVTKGLTRNIRSAELLAAHSTEHCLLLSRTLKLATECGDDARSLRTYPLLVTGMGRSGTMFTHESLDQRGLDFAHDDKPVGRHGAASWILAIREAPQDGSVKVPFAFPSFADLQKGFKGPNPKARFRVVVHQVRDALKAITSRANRVGMMFAPIKYSNPDMFRELADGTSAQLSYPPEKEMDTFRAEKGNKDWTVRKRLRVALWHYVLWNEWLDSWADYTVRVEDLSDEEHLVALCDLIDEQCPRSTRAKSTSKTTNSHEYIDELRDVTWDTLRDISPFMTDRAQALARSYGYAV